jgi:hypothetical protein
MLHVGPVSQTCAIIDIDREFIRTGDRATVAFRFVQRPEFLSIGDRILFREGRTKGLGIVKSLGYQEGSLGNQAAVQAGPEATAEGEKSVDMGKGKAKERGGSFSGGGHGHAAASGKAK